MTKGILHHYWVDLKELKLGYSITRYPSSTLFPLFYLGVSLLKLNSRKKETLFIEGLLGKLDEGNSIIYHTPIM